MHRLAPHHSTRRARLRPALIALLAVLVATPTVTADPARAESLLVIDSGHVDAFNVTARDGALHLDLKEDVTGYHVHHRPEDVVLHVKDSALIDIPAGYPGHPRAHYLPLAQNPDLVWPGWDTSDVRPDFSATRIAVESIDGPGEVNVWSTAFGGAVKPVLVGGGTQLPGTIDQPFPAHTHANWTFSAPGTYRLRVTVTGTRTDGTPATSNTATYTVVVGGPKPTGEIAPTIAFPQPDAATYGDDIPLAASSSTGAPVTYTSQTPSVCTLSGSSARTVSAGTCTVTASTPASGSTPAATPVTRSISVAKAPLTGAPAPATRYAGMPTPPRSLAWTGFVRGENASSAGITGSPACSSPGDSTNDAGTYAVTCAVGTLASNRYAFVLRPGTLEIRTGLYPVAPARILDTRSGLGVRRARLAPGDAVRVQVAGRSGVPSAATGAHLNVTAITPGASGYLTAYPTDRAAPATSNLNYDRATIAGAVLTGLGSDGTATIRNRGLGTIDLAVDVSGFVVGRSSSRPGDVVPTQPARLADTRATRAVPAGGSITVQVRGRGGVPTNAGASLLGLTAVAPSAAGWLTAYPAGTPRPTASNLNTSAGRTRATLAVTPLGSTGAVTVHNGGPAPVHVVLDSYGYAVAGTPTLPGHLGTVQPQRVLDTRTGLGTVVRRLDAGETRPFVATRLTGLPAAPVAAVLGSVTAVRPSGAGYLTLFPTGTARPGASTLNVSAGEPAAANAFLGVLGTGGSISAHNALPGPTDLLADVSAYVLR